MDSLGIHSFSLGGLNVSTSQISALNLVSTLLLVIGVVDKTRKIMSKLSETRLHPLNLMVIGKLVLK